MKKKKRFSRRGAERQREERIGGDASPYLGYRGFQARGSVFRRRESYGCRATQLSKRPVAGRDERPRSSASD